MSINDDENSEDLPSAPDNDVDFFRTPELDEPSTDKLMENIYRLETDLDSEREERREERFRWVLLSTVLLNVTTYVAIENFWAWLLLFLLQLIGLLGYAQNQGVDWAVKLLGWLIHWISERFGGDRPDEPN